MSAAALVADLERAGVTLTVHGDRLRWRAPEGVMTAAMVDALRRHKTDVIAVFNAKIAQGWGEAAGVVAWFLASEPPAGPFVLVWDDRGTRPAVKITRPETYWRSLRADIEHGPSWARSHYGGLQRDLRRLHGLFGGGDLRCAKS